MLGHPLPLPTFQCRLIHASTPVGSWRRTDGAGSQRATRWAGPGDQTRLTTNQKRLAFCAPCGGRSLAIKPDKQTKHFILEMRISGRHIRQGERSNIVILSVSTFRSGSTYRPVACSFYEAETYRTIKHQREPERPDFHAGKILEVLKIRQPFRLFMSIQ